MEKVTLEDGQSANIVSENIEKLKELFPDAFTEGGVNFDVLRQIMGDALVLDEGEEKYGLNWHGKKKARQIALTPSTGTLLPCPEESMDWDTTQNLFIEGDNLEVLKLLKKSYANKVKMIYIDPPYNTGNEFVYPDNFTDNLSTYLKYTGQVGEDGIKFSSNTETGGRKHTNWLNMMYPRLKTAKDLLSKDGIIFVSIDDHELKKLLALMSEIFGEENELVPFFWSLPRGINAGHISRAHEYVVGFAKHKDSLPLFIKQGDDHISIDRCNKKIDRRHPASKIKFPKGIRYEGKDKVISGEISGSEKVFIEGELRFENGKLAQEVTLEAGWTMKNMILDWLDGKDVYDTKGQKIVEFFFKENGKLYSKKKAVFESPKSILFDVPDTQGARKEILGLLGSEDIFSYPKPSGLIEKLVNLVTKDGDIVLDFFSGSSTTAHAVVNANAKDSQNRNWVLVQLPEKLNPNDEDQQAAINYCVENGLAQNIAEIGKDRIRKVIEKSKSISSEKVADLGFRIFKLSQSNIRAWNPDRSDLEETLLTHKDHLIEGRSEQDLLYELLLKRGIELTVPIEEKRAEGKTIYSIGSGVLFACLDTSIKADEVDNVAQGILDWHKELEPETDTHVFFRDSAFDDDIAKTNMAAILEQNGIHHVRSL